MMVRTAYLTLTTTSVDFTGRTNDVLRP
jgi:hypothetical protein